MHATDIPWPSVHHDRYHNICAQEELAPTKRRGTEWPLVLVTGYRLCLSHHSLTQAALLVVNFDAAEKQNVNGCFFSVTCLLSYPG